MREYGVKKLRSPACRGQTKRNIFTKFHTTWEGSLSAMGRRDAMKMWHLRTWCCERWYFYILPKMKPRQEPKRTVKEETKRERPRKIVGLILSSKRQLQSACIESEGYSLQTVGSHLAEHWNICCNPSLDGRYCLGRITLWFRHMLGLPPSNWFPQHVRSEEEEGG